MTDLQNNKEMIAVGHEFARTLSSDTPIIEIAKMITRLAGRLDCVTLALREMTKQRDALAVENAGLKSKGRELLTEACSVYEKFNATINSEDGDFIDGQTLHEFQFVLDCETPATDAVLAEERAQGAEMFAAYCGEENSVFVEAKAYYRSLPDAAYEFAAHLRQEAAQ